jgi:hypothetical protein
VTTVIGVDPQPVGATAVNCVSELLVTVVAGVLPKRTEVGKLRCSPVRTIAVPPWLAVPDGDADDKEGGCAVHPKTSAEVGADLRPVGPVTIRSFCVPPGCGGTATRMCVAVFGEDGSLRMAAPTRPT